MARGQCRLGVMLTQACFMSGRSRANERTFETPPVDWPRFGLVALSVLRLHACAVAACVRAGFRTAQVAWHLAIVDPLLVARLGAEPLLGGADRLVAYFAVGTRCRVGRG